MSEAGYKQLISYKLANIAFILGWEFVPVYYSKYEDNRQRDQIKQALRSHKQNIVEGDSERSLSAKLKLLDVAKSSGMEALEDFEDILKLERLPRWSKDDPRLKKLRQLFENYPVSNPSPPPNPSTALLREELGGIDGQEGLESVVNYLIDLLIRSGFFLDKQMNALEQKHQTEGGYNEKLLKKRLEYRKHHQSNPSIPPLPPSPSSLPSPSKSSLNMKGFVKLTKSVLISYLIVSTVLFGSGLLFLFNPFGTSKADAAWFNDNWGYRKRIDVTVTSSAADITNLDTQLTVDTTGITASLQTNCEDLRFTSTNGNILPYYIDSCNDNSATNKIWVRADLVPKNTTTYTLYMYYGNPGAGATSNQQMATLYNRLEGYWTLNESSWGTPNCSGSVFSDTSVNAISGKACPNSTGPTGGATGQYGNAVSFDGNDYLDLGQPAVLNADTAITVSAWVKPSANSLTAGYYDILGDYDGGGTTAHYEFTFKDGNLEYNYGAASSYVTYTPTSAIPFVAGSWYHVVFTHSGSNTDGTFYVNGVKYTSTKSGSVTIPGSGFGNTTIGAGGTAFATFQGSIDDVRIYHRTFTDSDVTQLYTTPGSITTSAVGTSKPTTSFASEEKGPSPTLYWKFDDPAVSSVIQDSTTNGLDGTLNNTPTFQTEDQCVAGKCYYFGATNQNVSIADDARLDFVAADNFTIGAWVKRNGASSANTVIIQKSGANIGSTYTGYKLYMDASGDFCFDIQDGTNAVDSACTSAVDFDDDAWHFVEGVKAATTSITLYVDGKQRAQDASIASTGSLANASTYRVGIDSDGTSNDWLGFIDEVKIVRDQTARTLAQVQADYNARSNPEGVSQQQGNNIQNMPAALSNGLVGYWKMDESSWTNDCSTTSVTDSSGNGNNGTACPNSTGPTGGNTGKYANGGTFDGVDDYALSPTMGGLTTYSMAFWVKHVATTATFEFILENNASGESNPSFESAGAGSSTFIYYAGNSTSISTTLPTGEWHHIVLEYSNATDFQALYKDGVLVQNISTTVSDSLAGIYWASRTGSQYFGNVTLDETRVYNRLLSAAEVSQLYNWAPGPVGYWKMDEGTGTQLMDSSGNGNNSTSPWTGSGVTWTGGKYGKGLNYPDSNHNSVVRIPEGTTLDLGNSTSSFTVESFFNIPSGVSQPSGGGYVVTKFSAAGDLAFLLNIVSTNQLQFEVNGGTDYIAAATVTVNDGKWHHFVGVRDIGTSQLRLYLDGVLLDTQTSVTAQDARNDDDISIGNGSSSYTSQDFNGNIDDVKIYNYARTPAQIKEDMNAGHPAPGSPVGTPVGYWKFNEGADNTCSGGSNDVCNSGSSGTSLDGTLTASSRTLSGKFGQALDGATNRRATIADSANLDFAAAEDLSISFWFKSDSATNPSANEYLVEKGGIVGTAAVGYAVYTASSGGTVCFGIDDDAVTNFPEDETCSSSDIYDATWHHIVAKKTGTSRLDLSVDGKPNGTADTAISATGTLDNAATFYIGDANATDGTDEFLGDMDDAKVYRSALTADQIKLDMNQSSTQVLGSFSSSQAQPNSAASEYCIPGDGTTCTGPVGRWDFEEGTGTNVFDTSGNANTGSVPTGATYTIGKTGKGLNFAGTEDAVRVTQASAINNLTNLTVSTWVYLTAAPSANARIFDKTDGSGLNGWRFYIQSNRTLYADTDYSVTDPFTTTSATVPLNTWTFLSASFNSSSLTWKLYINGVDSANSTTVGNGSAPNDAASNLGIAGKNDATSRTLTGKIDQARAFNYVRTPAQIAWDYNRGAPAGYWKMDECQGTTINDSSGNSNTGTLTNAATPGTCTTSGSWFNGVSGKRNYSMDFDGADDIINAGSGASLDNLPVNGMTIGAWIYPRTIGENSAGFIVDKNTGSSQNAGWLFLGIGTNALQFVVDGATDLVATSSNNALTLNTWQYVTMSWDGVMTTASSVHIYVNGKEVSYQTQTNGATRVDDGASSFYIGNDSTTARTFDGLIDDVKAFNYPLTTTQIKTIYNDGAYRTGPVTGAP